VSIKLAGGLVPRPRARGRIVTTDSNHADPIAPNLPSRQFDVASVALNQVWVGDITYVPTRDGFVLGDGVGSGLASLRGLGDA